jgi:23S rRNA pseudouridine2605 synthase
VTVNHGTARLGTRVMARDVVEVDGVSIPTASGLVYLALNKPVGVVTTARDPAGRTTVLDLVETSVRVFPVGRLDRDTSGLLFLTNDGMFAERIAHPRYEIPKTYVAEVRGKFSAAALRRGVRLEDGFARAERVAVKAAKAGRGVVELTVREGRNRLVRRMLEATGVDVVSLTRTAIGPIGVGRLRPGTWRKLRADEVLRVVSAAAPVD